MTRLLAAFALALLPQLAQAQGAVTYETDQSFDDVIFGLESAILDAGLVIDSVSHTGEMLERTRADLGSDVVLFSEADVYSFCSAALSRKVMEADPMNVAHCPYGIFVAETGDGVFIGRRDYPAGIMDKVEAMLDAIIEEAAFQ